MSSPGDRITSHLHLWHLDDGTPLYAPLGTLVTDPQTGELRCHFCGGWYQALGGHVRVHGWSASEYRNMFGLARSRALSASDLSAARAERQRARYESSAELRDQLAPGREMARTGALRARARAGNQELTMGADRRRREALDAGRITMARQRTSATDRAVRAAGGAEQVAQATRAQSADEVARTKGLPRALVRQMSRRDAVLRRPGQNTGDGKRSRAISADAAAAVRVGATDIAEWLRNQRAQGMTLAELALAVGHSVPWVRSRLGAA